MSSDESENSGPTSGSQLSKVVQVNQQQLSSLLQLKQENGTPLLKIIPAPALGNVKSEAVLSSSLFGGKKGLSLGAVVKNAAQLLHPLSAGADQDRMADQHATSGQDSQDEDDQETAGISGRSSPYGALGKSMGPSSPSPYTANTARAKAFNAYVKGLIEQKLDLYIPISLQPRELLAEIIGDVQNKFPDFSGCVRKRIRTFLKSYRRSKKVRESIAVANATTTTYSTNISTTVQPTQNGGLSTSTGLLPVTTSCGGVERPFDAAQNLQTAIVTIAVEQDSSPSPTPPPSNAITEEADDLPSNPKRARLDSPLLDGSQSSSSLLHETDMPSPQLSHQSQGNLCTSEVSAVRQLIMGYRESAAFLLRAADKLEQILPSDNS